MLNPVADYVLEHLHWPAVCWAAWWMRGKIEDFLTKAEAVHEQTTNHLPTELGKQTILLQSIDKNLAVMAARRDEINLDR